MFRRPNEEWERQKWYLIRSLFEDLPLLSPIHETQEQTFVQQTPSAVPIERAYSPLPDLIIEKEPNRHDEPDEYYQYLEKRVKEIYRKLFLESDTSSLGGSLERDFEGYVDLDVCNQTANDQTNRLEKRSRETEDTRSSIDDNATARVRTTAESDDNPNTNSSEPNIDISVESPISTEKETGSIYSDTSGSQEAEQSDTETTAGSLLLPAKLVTQAVVHQAGKDLELSQDHGPHTSTRTEDTGVSTERDAQVETNTSNEVNNVNSKGSNGLEEQEFQQHAGTREALLEFTRRSKSDNSSSNDDPEAMRRQTLHSKSLHSSGMITAERDLSRLHIDKEYVAADVHLEMEEAEHSFTQFSIILGTTSTPKHLQHAASDGASKRGVLSEISSNPSRYSKRRKCENLAVQTSFSTSDDEMDWERLKHNFFEGVPSIFRLCSCNNHRCC